MSDIPTKVSVAAEAVYPHLVKPDVRFNEFGEYKVTLKLSKQDASQMVKDIDQAIEHFKSLGSLIIGNVVPGAGHNNTPTVWLFTPEKSLVELIQQ